MGSFRTADTARIPYQDEPVVGAFVDGFRGLGFRGLGFQGLGGFGGV